MSRVLTPLLSVAAMLAASPAVRAADDEARAVIVRAIKAHGGEEQLAKYKASQSRGKGKITLPGVGEVEFTQEVSLMQPDKFKETTELTVGGQNIKVVTVVNGDKMSIEANGQAVEVNDQIKATLTDARHLLKVARMRPLVHEKGYDLALAGEVKVEGKSAVGVLVTAKGQKDVSLYFDKETGLLAKLEHRTVDAATGNEVNEERVVLEYKKSENGIPVAKRVAVRRDGKPYIELEVLESTLLEKLDDSEFKK
jgi:hypothetical protein